MNAIIPIITISNPLLIRDSPVILVFKAPTTNNEHKDNTDEITNETIPKLRKYGN